MPKSEMEVKFDLLVSNIWRHFKPLGYKKQGNNFRYYSREQNYGKIVNFQKSRWGSKNDITFTVNIGLYLPDFEFYLRGEYPSGSFCEYDCFTCVRIGELIAKRDTWFELNDEADIGKVYEEVESYFVKFVLPYLDAFNSKDDILRLGIGRYCPTLAALKTLYHNGYQDTALKLWDEKYAAAKNDAGLLKYLDDFKKEMIEGKPFLPDE